MLFALVECWWGYPCAVHRDRSPGSTARWEAVTAEEYAELEAEGFRVCRSWVGPGPGSGDDRGSRAEGEVG